MRFATHRYLWFTASISVAAPSIALAQLSITPLNLPEPNRAIHTSGYSTAFRITRTGSGSPVIISYTCAAASTVASCIPPTGTLLGGNSSVDVNVTYATGNAGSGTVTLRATGPGLNVAEAFKSVTVVVPAGAPRIDALPFLDANQDYSRCAASCFAVTHAQSTIPYLSLDTPRNVTLAYHGDRVQPKPFFLVDIAPDSAFGTWPSEFQLKVKVNGSYVTFVNGEQTLRFSVGATNDKTYRIGGQYSPSGLTHGTVYPVEIEVSSKIGATLYTNRWITGYLHLNESASPIASGWTLAGIQRAFVQADGSLLITEGNGSATYFKKIVTFGTASWPSPAGDFSRVTQSGSNYVRAYPDSTKVTFNASGYLTTVVDRWGNATSITLDGSNRVWKVTDPIGNIITLGYGANGLNTITDPFGRVTTLTVGTNFLLTKVADPGGGNTQFGYDGSNRLQTVTDRRGSVTTYTYDAQSGKLSTITPPAVPIFGQGTVSPVTTLAAWHKGGVPYSATAVTAFAQPLASTVKGTVTEPGGAVTSFTVNRWGSPANTYQPLSDTTYVTFNSDGLPAVIRRPGFPATTADTIAYNASGLPISIYRAGSTKTLITYGGWGQVTDASGSGQPTIKNILGANGRITTTQIGSPLQTIRSYTYDAFGRIATMGDANGLNVVSNVYYATGTHRNLNTSTNAAGGTMTLTYDSYGRQASVSGPTGSPRYLFYDGLNRLLRDSVATTPTATVTRFGYDSLFRLRVTDPKNQVYGYGYNALGWVVADTFPANRVQSYQYSRDGDVVRVTNRRSQVIDFGYDALHRLTRRTAGANVAAWGYPVADHGFRVVDSSTKVINTTFFNLRGTADSVQTLLRDVSQTHRIYYGYSTAGLLATVTFNTLASPALVNRTYSYDTFKGRLTGIQLGAATTSIAQNGNGADTSMTFPGGDRERELQTPFGPAMDSALAAYASDLLRQTGYNAASQIENQVWVASPVNLKGRFYTYDGMRRLQLAENKTTTISDPVECFDPVRGYYSCVQETWTPVSGESNTYAYDAVGNRTDKGGSYLTGTNRITAFAGWTYNTDLDGNVTNRDSTGMTTTFTWNAEGQLTNTTKTGRPNVAYYYDANGRLVRKDTGAAIAYFLWDGDNILAELGSNGTSKVAEYSYRGIDELHALIQDSSGTNVARYAHDDGLGNLQALTNSGGTAVTRTFKYDDWGRLTDSTGASLQPATERVRWKGALLMGGETDTYFMRNRWYEPATGRFLSEDPIGLDGGINPTAFSGADPTNNRDPFGLECVTWVLVNDIYDQGVLVVRLYEVLGSLCTSDPSPGAGASSTARRGQGLNCALNVGIAVVSVVADATLVGGFALRATSAAVKLGSGAVRIALEGAVARRVTYGMQSLATSIELDLLSAVGRGSEIARNATQVNPYALFGQELTGALAGNKIDALEILKDLIPIVGSVDAVNDARAACGGIVR